MESRGKIAGLACSALAWLVVGCAGPTGIVYATGPNATTRDGLQRVRWTDLGVEYVKPGADLQPYRAILIEPLQIAPESPAEERRSFAPEPHYTPSPLYLQQMAERFHDSFDRQLSRAGFATATATGPGVLRLSAAAVDLVVTAPIDPQDQVDEADVVSSFGEFTLLLDLQDATSGAPLVRVIDRVLLSRSTIGVAAVDSQGAIMNAQRESFDRIAQLLGERLNGYREVPALPPAP